MEKEQTITWRRRSPTVCDVDGHDDSNDDDNSMERYWLYCDIGSNLAQEHRPTRTRPRGGVTPSWWISPSRPRGGLAPSWPHGFLEPIGCTAVHKHPLRAESHLLRGRLRPNLPHLHDHVDQRGPGGSAFRFSPLPRPAHLRGVLSRGHGVRPGRWP